MNIVVAVLGMDDLESIRSEHDFFALMQLRFDRREDETALFRGGSPRNTAHGPQRAGFIHRALRPVVVLLDRFHGLHFRHSILEHTLDPHFQGHLAHGASTARSGQANLYRAVVGNVHEFAVAAVSLKLGAN
jgi:hypothetical protein